MPAVAAEAAALSPGDAAADNGEIGLDDLLGRGAEPGRGADAGVAEAMVEGAAGADQPVAQGAKEAARDDGVAALADGDEIEPVEGRGALHRQQAAATGADQRRETLLERQRRVAVPAGHLDAIGEGGRQHGVAGKAGDLATVEPEAERLGPIDGGAAQAVRGVGGKAVRNRAHAGTTP